MKEFAPLGANSFLLDLTLLRTAGKKEEKIEKLIPLKVYQFTSKSDLPELVTFSSAVRSAMVVESANTGFVPFNFSNNIYR